jgi:NitT/TauT family transport system permease protein
MSDAKSDPPAPSPAPAGKETAPAAAKLPGPPVPFAPLRAEISLAESVLAGTLCVALCGAVWWVLTSAPEPEQRIVGSMILPSPGETFGELPRLLTGDAELRAEAAEEAEAGWWRNLFSENALIVNVLVTLRRVVLGFGLAVLVGVPLGILCGCFTRLSAFLAPLVIVGRNIPIAALIPLTFSLFGIGEFQKVMFIFIACVAFVIGDAAGAVADIRSQYIDTACTLGASRLQVVLKVLVPLAMPNVFNSLRLLFGLAFGYIMLAELVTFGSSAGGLGHIILMAQRRNLLPRVYLVLLLIPLIALALDRLLFLVQRQLFPYQYGGSGLLHRGVGALARAWEDARSLVFRRKSLLKNSQAAGQKSEVPTPNS